MSCRHEPAPPVPDVCEQEVGTLRAEPLDDPVPALVAAVRRELAEISLFARMHNTNIRSGSDGTV
jgi:hypothetical protein